MFSSNSDMFKLLILNPCCYSRGIVFLFGWTLSRWQLNKVFTIWHYIYIYFEYIYLYTLYDICITKYCIYFELLMGLVERASWIYFGDRWMRRRESCLAVTTQQLYNICRTFVQYLYIICSICVHYLCNICTMFVQYLWQMNAKEGELSGSHNCSDPAMSYFVQYFYNISTIFV